MGEKPLSRKITALFTTVAAVGLLTPFNLRIGDDTVKADEPPAPSALVLHPVGTPIEHVDHSHQAGGISTSGGGGGMPIALSIKIGRP